MAPDTSSPTTQSSAYIPFLSARSRRGSLASITSRKEVDKSVLQQALDAIHTNEARSQGLTSFHDFDGEGRSVAKELVSSGVTGLYHKLRQSVVGGVPAKEANSGSGGSGRTRPKSSESHESLEAASQQPTSTSPSASRSGVKSMSIRRPGPEAQSSHTLSVPPSPIVRTFVSNDSTDREAKANGPKPESRLVQSQASHEPGDLAVDPQQNTRGTKDTLTQQDVDRARNALADNDQSKPATDALARVLSHHEVAITERPEQSKKRVRDEEIEDAIDDSDYADGPDDALLPPSQTLAGEAARTSMPPPPQIDPHRDRPPLLRVGVSHLPGFDPSRTSSTTDGADVSSAPSSHAPAKRPILDPSPNLNIALQRRRTGLRPQPSLSSTLSVSTHSKRRLLDREFWMKDENAKVCFSCGLAFSTFRRKHHCRACGQIFDAKCTSIVSGRAFGQTSNVRLCITCEGIVFGDDDSTVFSDDDDYQRSPAIPSLKGDDIDALPRLDGHAFSRPDVEVSTPSIGIPVSRRNREAKRRSAVIEFDTHTTLARPSSAHSLVSLSRRPRSSSHRRRHSRHHPRLSRASIDAERAPFHQGHIHGPEQTPALPTFHNDNIIDPDLAAFLSDEGSDEDDQPNIMSAVSDIHAPSPGEREKLGFGSFFTSGMRKGRSRGTDKRVAASSSAQGIKDDEKPLPKSTRTRNLSNGSTGFSRPSPRRSRSNLLTAAEADGYDQPVSPLISAPTTNANMICVRALQHSRSKVDLQLYPASYEHVKKLLAQLLSDYEIPNQNAWHKALMTVLLKCTDDVEPDVQHGDDMDIRHYIKLKKVPGGRPIDTTYVSGVVFSKNIALKTMPRSVDHPRILILSFSLEYARHESHFMSLDPVMRQEREYLSNLVKRIADLEPSVLLVQKHISGLALELLEKAGIVVAYNIKSSVLAAVARMTQTSVVTSIDKLGMEQSRLGYCKNFDVKTYVAEGRRKSYIYLSGCDPDLGCTVVLRGADTRTLRNIKRISEFMCYVAYNLKLEKFFLRDELALIPQTAPSQIEAHDHPVNGITQSNGDSDGTQQAINQTLAHALENGAEHEFKYEEEEQRNRERILSASPFVVFMQPYILTQLRDLERRLATYKMLRDQYAAADEDGDNDSPNEKTSEYFSLVKPDMVNAPPSRDQPKAVREYLHAVHEAQLEEAEYTFKTQERQWDSFANGQVNPFDPFSHQKIVVLYSTISSTSVPCSGPDLLGIGFYASYNNVEPHHDEDITIGQYLEDLCLGASKICPLCNKRILEHSRQYVHGYGQLTVSVHRQAAKAREQANNILMWSSCRICHQETDTVQMSDATWKYSFAKYLELSFWSSPLQHISGPCQHDMHKDYLRYFGFEDMVVRVQYDPIEIFDLVVPRARVTWKVDADLRMKNSEYSHFERRLFDFTESVKKRLDSILPDALVRETASQAFDARDKLRERVEKDHAEILAKLQLKYANSRYYELIPLNRALRFMHDKAIEWDDEFAKYEEEYFLSEENIRQVAVTQLKTMFYGDQTSVSTAGSDAESDIEDGTEMQGMPEKLIAEEELDHEDAINEKTEKHSGQAGQSDELQQAGDNTVDVTFGSELARVTTPLKDLEEAVEREDVKHLDLAVPSQVSPTHRFTIDRLAPEDFARSTNSPEEGRRQDEPFAIQPKPLSTGLLERIEAIRGSRTVDESEAKLESKIPRLADLQKTAVQKKDGQSSSKAATTPPPLARTKSSPGHPGNPFTLNGDQYAELSIDAIASGSAQPTKDDKSKLEHRRSDRLGVARLASKVGKIAPSLIPRSMPTRINDNISSVSSLAKHFDQMSREFEKKRLKEREQMAKKSRQSRANPLASSRPVVEVYQNATDAVGDQASVEKQTERDKDEQARRRMEEEVASNQPEDNPLADSDQKSVTTAVDDEASAAPAMDGDELTEATDGEGESMRSPTRSRDTSDPTSGLHGSVNSAQDIAELGPELSIPEHKKNVWLDKLADFWRKRSAVGWAELEYPLHSNEHVFSDSDIVVREDEPSSVIAFALACTDYRAKEKEFRSNPSRTPLAKQGHAHTPSQTSAGPATKEDNQRIDIEASLLSESNTHFFYTVNDGPAKASCKVFYAQSFDALRRKCGVENRFVESMSRCLKFDSKGGKTKSVFLRTLDNRFIIKSLQEVELKAFNKFAPDYFSFMSHTLFHGVPSVIAKMLGLFQVNIRNPATGIDYSYYLLVMENLFYERSPTRRFDLKGSMRNRRIVPTNDDDEVLLDENLVDTLFEKPLFVREHSRKLLQASIFNDTLWLCKQNVMDYSLIAGFDDHRKELIVGIIDCIRTYTWDKKLESWIKDRGKNKPTITSPKDYRNRFRVSMMQYVLQAPNCWHQFQTQMPPPKTLRERPDVEEGQGVETGTEAEEVEMRMSGDLIES